MWKERLKLEQSVLFDVKTNRVEKLSFLAKHKHRRFSPVNTLLAGFRLVEGSQGIKKILKVFLNSNEISPKTNNNVATLSTLREFKKKQIFFVFGSSSRN